MSRIVLLALLAAGACAGAMLIRGESPPALSPPGRKGRTVALVGESHAQVIFPLLASALAARGYRVVVQEARPGWSASRFAADAALMAQLAAARPDVLVVLASGNNTVTDPTRYRAVVEAFTRTAGRTLWVGPSTAVREPYAAQHARTRSLEAGVVPSFAAWFDSAPVTSTGHRDDGVHFGTTTYRTWAAAILGTPALA